MEVTRTIMAVHMCCRMGRVYKSTAIRTPQIFPLRLRRDLSQMRSQFAPCKVHTSAQSENKSGNQLRLWDGPHCIRERGTIPGELGQVTRAINLSSSVHIVTIHIGPFYSVFVYFSLQMRCHLSKTGFCGACCKFGRIVTNRSGM